MIWIILLILFILSFVFAVRASRHELSVPSEVKKIRITRKKSMSGVILFLKEKIVHYSSNSS